MPEELIPSEPAGETLAAVSPNGEQRDKKKKANGKVRSAWISFVGRIVAQLVGAVATVMLGVIVLQKYSAAETRTANSASVKRVSDSAVAKPGVHVRITAQLIDMETDQPVWAQTYDSPLDEFLPLQAEVATAIAQQVNATLSTP